MSFVTPNFGAAVKKNAVYDRDYGQYKNVQNPMWVGAEGDKAALFRGSYPNTNVYSYFNGATYNNYYRNFVTTGLQGKGTSIYDRVQLTGADDYYSDGRNVKEYQLVSMQGIDTTDMMVGMAILGGALAFILLSRR
jgi:hypothetical protein